MESPISEDRSPVLHNEHKGDDFFVNLKNLVTLDWLLRDLCHLFFVGADWHTYLELRLRFAFTYVRGRRFVDVLPCYGMEAVKNAFRWRDAKIEQSAARSEGPCLLLFPSPALIS